MSICCIWCLTYNIHNTSYLGNHDKIQWISTKYLARYIFVSWSTTNTSNWTRNQHSNNNAITHWLNPINIKAIRSPIYKIWFQWVLLKDLSRHTQKRNQTSCKTTTIPKSCQTEINFWSITIRNIIMASFTEIKSNAAIRMASI